MHMMGGMALFLYGMTLTKNGLQLFAGDRLRSVVHNLTENRLMGLGVGALVTTIIQSSTATTVMLVGFASAGLVTLRQSYRSESFSVLTVVWREVSSDFRDV